MASWLELTLPAATRDTDRAGKEPKVLKANWRILTSPYRFREPYLMRVGQRAAEYLENF
jgi:hypothetical protein